MQLDPPLPGWAQTGNLVWSLWAEQSLDACRRRGAERGGVPGHALWLEAWDDRLHSRELVETTAPTRSRATATGASRSSAAG
ncbi:MAG: hypothetical protein CO096_16995 [Armatimonadetes bacterium CG_4_9_14_3_um_filter_66_14]|nr:MAG: hypothetical protein CO096_16995 [Armatimonadetes bacterium CG_4_9_14_3_um_filter_66_14]